MATYNNSIDGDDSTLLSNLSTAKTNGKTIHTITDGSATEHCFVFQPSGFYTKTANDQSVTGVDLVDDIFGAKDIKLHLIRGATNGKFFDENVKDESGGTWSGGFGGLISAMNGLIGSEGSNTVNFLGLGTEGSYAAIKAPCTTSWAFNQKINHVVCQEPVNKIPDGDFDGYDLPSPHEIAQSTMSNERAVLFSGW